MPKVNQPFRGIVMSRKPFRERDLLVKILTDARGPVMFFVRGAQRKGFKMAADILPFTRGEYVGLLSDEGLSYIVSAGETHQWQGIVADLGANAYATYLLDLVNQAFDEGRGIGGWFKQVEAALDQMNAGKDPQIITNVLEVQLLPFFGVAPVWDRCVICGRQQGTLDYSESYGGMLCFEHYELDEHRLRLDQRVVGYLKLFAQLNLQTVGEINVKPAVKKQLSWALDKIYDDQVGLRLKSKRFIQSMDQWSQSLQLARNEAVDNQESLDQTEESRH